MNIQEALKALAIEREAANALYQAVRDTITSAEHIGKLDLRTLDAAADRWQAAAQHTCNIAITTLAANGQHS